MASKLVVRIEWTQIVKFIEKCLTQSKHLINVKKNIIFIILAIIITIIIVKGISASAFQELKNLRT